MNVAHVPMNIKFLSQLNIEQESSMKSFAINLLITKVSFVFQLVNIGWHKTKFSPHHTSMRTETFEYTVCVI